MANIKSQIKRNRQNHKARRAQQGRAQRAEDPHQERRHGRRDGCRERRRARPPRREAHRQGRHQGRHPQERRRPPQVPPDEEAPPPPTDQRRADRAGPAPGSVASSATDIVARRATSTSSTRWSGQALPPRRSRSASASRSIDPHDPVVAELAGLAQRLLGREGRALHAEQLGRLLLARDVGAVEAQHPGVVGVQGGQHLERVALALADHPLQQLEGRRCGRPGRWRR